MRYSLWRSSVLILVSLLFLAAGGCRADKDPWTASEAWHSPVEPKGQDWSYDGVEGLALETAHYRIYTTVNDAQLLEKLPDFLETAYQRYEAYLPLAEVQEQPLEVYLFGRRYEWEKYTRENMGPLAEKYLKIRAGAYAHKGVCVAYLLDPYHTFGVLAHEGFHQFSNYRLQHRIPAWMEEGLACNFEAHFWRGGSADFAPDLNEFRISALKRALRGGTLFELSELLSMDAGDAVILPAERTATYYAQVWALTRFLQEGQKGKYRPGFKQFLEDAADGANLYSQERASRIELERQKGEWFHFTSAIAHELKTPLTSIIAGAELLSEELQGEVPEPHQKLVQNIVRSARSLETNLDELLDITKMRSLVEVQLSPLNIRGLIEQVTEYLKPIAERKEQALIVDLPDFLPSVNADAQRLEQVLRNLVMTAVKFTPPGGRINLRARKQEGSLVVEVQDSGIGIAREKQAGLFEPYYRAEVDRELFPGMGLGLALSKQILELHGGKIWVDSQPGKGSTFAFSLPL